ncbi:MAG: hypothetical protein HeimC3_41860 [Candidatus Heimdallarchaeota archaeon LC_3]|nr:MAG: hypothetical protein HeimC3_41860 [Candidatus Heimdallarchaeota archaeon LC_3]
MVSGIKSENKTDHSSREKLLLLEEKKEIIKEKILNKKKNLARLQLEKENLISLNINKLDSQGMKITIEELERSIEDSQIIPL